MYDLKSFFDKVIEISTRVNLFTDLYLSLQKNEFEKLFIPNDLFQIFIEAYFWHFVAGVLYCDAASPNTNE